MALGLPNYLPAVVAIGIGDDSRVKPDATATLAASAQRLLKVPHFEGPMCHQYRGKYIFEHRSNSIRVNGSSQPFAPQRTDRCQMSLCNGFDLGTK